MKSVLLPLLISYFLHRTEGDGNSLVGVSDECKDPENVRDLQQCTLCTKDVNKKCFTNGVHDRFFHCNNLADPYPIDCDAKHHATIIENYISINPTASQMCYFEILYSTKEYTRLYVNKTHGCSNSTKFKVARIPSAESQYMVYSRALTELKVGPYIFSFANNKTYQAFYYSVEKRNEIEEILGSIPKYVQETSTGKLILHKAEWSKEFGDCIDYNARYTSKEIRKYIRCQIDKMVSYKDKKVIHHTDINGIICHWNWNASKSEFELTIRNFRNPFTEIEVPHLMLNKFGLVGYLQCRIINRYSLDRINIEESFGWILVKCGNFGVAVNCSECVKTYGNESCTGDCGFIADNPGTYQCVQKGSSLALLPL